MEKRCPNCKEIKLYIEFFKCSSKVDGLQVYCKICIKERFKESKKKSDKKYASKWLSIPENKEKKKEYAKQYQINNPEKQKEYSRKHRQSEKGIQTRKQYRKEEYDQKYKIDTVWTLKLGLRNRLKNAIKKGFKKGKTLEILGCPIEEFKVYLERQFDENMNWENHGTIWEIDHIKPCDFFDLICENQQKECFHYTNLQPLFKTTEIAKSFGYTDQIGNRNKSNKL
jgi:hypothetical protein